MTDGGLEMRQGRQWTVIVWLVVTAELVLAGCSTNGDGSSDVVSDAAVFDDSGAGGAAVDDTADDSADDATIGDTDSGDDTGEDSDDDVFPAPDAERSFAFAQDPGEPSDEVPTALTPADIGREIVFRADLEVEVDDVAGASAVAAQRIRAIGGLVFGQITTTDPEPRTVLTFKVLPADFDTALIELAGLGSVRRQSITADDVTERIVDLESRIITSAASVIRLRELLNDAGDVNIIVNLEGQLLQRETNLEQLRGQLRTLRDQVNLATITLTITRSATVLPPAGLVTDAWLGADVDDACPGSSELAVGEKESAVLCVEVENVGEATLTDVEIESDVLRLRTGDFDIVSGDPTTLAPRDRLVATLRLDVEDGRVRRREVGDGLFIDIVVSAEPADRAEFGQSLHDRSEVVLLVSATDDPLPGFGDALGGGTDALQGIASIMLIGVGVFLPFAPFVAIVIGALWWWRGRRAHP